MSSENEQSIGRRDAIKIGRLAGLSLFAMTTLGSAAFLYSELDIWDDEGGIYDTDGNLRIRAAVTMSPDEMKTRVAYGTRDVRIQETAVAYMRNPKKLKEIMDRIPDTLGRDAVKLYDQYSHKKYIHPYGFVDSVYSSGTVTSYDAKNGRLVMLTARHFFDTMDFGDLETTTISHSHVSDESFTIPSEDISVYSHPIRDIAIAVVQIPQGVSFPDDLGTVRIDETWIPTVGETLYSLSYPGATYDNLGYFPTIFTVTKTDAERIDAVVADGLIGEGSSGAAVVKEDGAIVGVLGYFQPEGAYILPIRDTYRNLLVSVR